MSARKPVGPELEDGVDRIQQAWQRERPGTPVESIGVITRIWRLAKMLADDRRRTLDRLGIDGATLDLLSTLRRSGSPYSLPASELARRCLVSAGAITQRVARAEQSGWVKRAKSTVDGRSVLVTLTAKGRRHNDRAVAELLAHEESLLSGLGGDQREELSGLLRVLLSDLTDRFGLDDRPDVVR